MHAATAASRIEREHKVISRSLRKILVPGPQFRLTTAFEPERGDVERFIADKFRTSHNARVASFLPAILNIQCGEKFTAALGINPAVRGPMFLENYLDQPAEQAIAALTRTPISRTSIVEIGNLVSTLNGSTALLYLMLLAIVHKAGFHWVMFTATPEVRRSIEKLGFKIAPVCGADPSRLPNPEQWGSYYDVKPQVMLGYIEESFRACHDNRLLDSVLQLTEVSVNELADKLGRV